MTTFSSVLKLELPGDGQQSGTWGQTTNKNFGTLVEQAITGVQTITMVDANYTLSNLNGVSDEARNPVIIATGTNSAIRDVIAPLVTKMYWVYNNTTGGYAINFKAASGTSVSIPNGTITAVYCDGTDFKVLINGTAGNFTINGNGSITGTLALGGALTATTATFSGAISSLNPTFTGTPTAPTAASGTNTTQIATTAFANNAVTTGTAANATNAANLVTSNWTVTESGGKLYFKYGGVNKMSLDSSGNIIAIGNVTAYGTP